MPDVATREGVAEDFGRAVGAVDLDRRLADWTEDAELVKLLKRVAVHLARHGRAAQDHHGRVAHQRAGGARQQVGDARAVLHQADAGAAGGARVAHGHEARALLVAAADEADVGAVIHGVQYLQEGRADDAEDVLHALGPQRLHHGLSGGHSSQCLFSYAPPLP